MPGETVGAQQTVFLKRNKRKKEIQRGNYNLQCIRHINQSICMDLDSNKLSKTDTWGINLHITNGYLMISRIFSDNGTPVMSVKEFLSFRDVQH